MKPASWTRAPLLVVLTVFGAASAQSPAVVPYPQAYKTTLVRYAVVDRSDGMSRDLYVSRDAIEALRGDPRLKEFPAGVLFALAVHGARAIGRDAKTGAPLFEVTPQGRPVRSKHERTRGRAQERSPGFGSQAWALGRVDPTATEPWR